VVFCFWFGSLEVFILADHLLDSARNRVDLSPRHYFHFENIKIVFQKSVSWFVLIWWAQVSYYTLGLSNELV